MLLPVPMGSAIFMGVKITRRPVPIEVAFRNNKGVQLSGLGATICKGPDKGEVFLDVP